MRFSKIAVVVAATTVAEAQRPTDTSICDYYTTALLKENTAENQLTLLTLVVNTVVIGNYTMPNVGIKVPGILAAGQYEGTDVNLLPYFNGELASSNRGGNMGVSINSLDGGGAEPLKKNMPANDKNSRQYFLLTHLYQFFGSLLGCSQQGMPGFDAYTGQASMYKVHKFMDLNPYEVGYFIQQVGLAAASFGVAEADVQAVGTALNSLFGYRCAPPATAIKAQGPQLQSICIDGACPVSPDNNGTACDAYEPVVVPRNTTSNTTTPAPGSMGTETMSGGGGGGGAGSGAGGGADGGMNSSMTGMPSYPMATAAGSIAYAVSFAAVVAGAAGAATFLV